MDRTLVMTLVGPDRAGLVEAIASRVADCGGNWIESRMANLSGSFAGIVRVQVPADQSESLKSRVRALEGEGLHIVVVEHGEGSDTEGGARGARVTLELVGQDHPGIVSELTRRLATLGVNVEELETECVSAPMSGEMLFKAVARLGLPVGLDADSLLANLEETASDLMVDVKIDESPDSV